MPCITTCTRCGSLYEAGSEEQANEPSRICPECFRTLMKVECMFCRTRMGWKPCAPTMCGHTTNSVCETCWRKYNPGEEPDAEVLASWAELVR